MKIFTVIAGTMLAFLMTLASAGTPAVAADLGSGKGCDFVPTHQVDVNVCGGVVQKKYHCPDVKPHAWLGMNSQDKLKLQMKLDLWEQYGCKEAPPPSHNPPPDVTPPDDDDDCGCGCTCEEDDSDDEEWSEEDDEEWDGNFESAD